MRIYISGPITGTDDYMERFAKAEEALIARGHSVVNPAKVNANLPKDTTWQQYMTVSIAMLKTCEAIYMLKNWDKSKGAQRELDDAFIMGIKVVME